MADSFLTQVMQCRFRARSAPTRPRRICIKIVSLTDCLVMPSTPVAAPDETTDPAGGTFVRFDGSPFELYQPYPPAGDQPEAIDQLVEGVEDGEVYQILLGVTGSGKTFTMANVIARLGRPAIVYAPNKTLAAQLYSEFREFFPEERSRVLRELLRLLPARGLRTAARSVHRKGQRDQ